jgi:ATP-dependent protease Clp ATPase subunit
MLDLMYQLPSERNVKECVITRDMVKKIAPAGLMQKAG